MSGDVLRLGDPAERRARLIARQTSSGVLPSAAASQASSRCCIGVRTYIGQTPLIRMPPDANSGVAASISPVTANLDAQ